MCQRIVSPTSSLYSSLIITSFLKSSLVLLPALCHVMHNLLPRKWYNQLTETNNAFLALLKNIMRCILFSSYRMPKSTLHQEASCMVSHAKNKFETMDSNTTADCLQCTLLRSPHFRSAFGWLVRIRVFFLTKVCAQSITTKTLLSPSIRT